MQRKTQGWIYYIRKSLLLKTFNLEILLKIIGQFI